MAELLTKGIEAIAVVARATLKDPKRGAPNVTLKQFNKAQCDVIAEKGLFRMSAYRRALTHDRAWDELFKKHDSLRSAFSHISSTFWTWNSGAVSIFNRKARNLICLRDMTYGAKSTCWTGKPTPGQLAAVEAVAKSKNPTVLKYMEAYFSMVNGKPLELFSNMEKLVARNDLKLLKDIKALADSTKLLALALERAASKMADDGENVKTRKQLVEATFNIANQHEALEQAVSKMPDRGVSVNAAAQLAAAAFNKAAEIAAVKGCSDSVAQALNKKGNLWLRITRRLAHGSEAMYWQENKETMQDPLFVARTTSALWCAAQIVPANVASALNYFNVQGTRGAHLSGVSLAFLVSAKMAADGVMVGCGKVVTPPVPPVVGPCKDKNAFRNKMGDCVCKVGWKLNQLTKKCYKDGGDPPVVCKKDEVRRGKKCFCKPGTIRWKKGACLPKCEKGYYRVSVNRCKKKCSTNEDLKAGKCVCKTGHKRDSSGKCKKPAGMKLIFRGGTKPLK